ncbi:MAG: type IV pilus biogenesis ATPase PilM [uncultured bacterium]|nr:MAG: type IV pilus biogenesis ATPase PilM [uncultured bacterium]
MPLEEMVLDWKILKEDSKEMTVKKAGESEGAGQINRQGTGTEVIKVKNIKVLLTAAPKDLVNRYVEIFRKAGKTLSNLETESFAIERSLIGSDKSIVMVVDIGAVVTNISIFSEGIPLLNRSIDIGGETITKAIANSLKIDQSRAEQFKRDFGLSASGGYQESIPKTIEFVISSILNEIKHVINLFRSREGGELEKIILTGGSAFLPNLPEYLSNILNLKVHVGDPWARVIYPLDLKPVLDEIAPQMAVAIGLAMRDII